MLAEIAIIFLGLSLVASCYTILSTGWGLTRQNRYWLHSGQYAVYITPVLLGITLALLALAFLSDDFSLIYVTQHSAAALSPWLKLSALWAGQEGSLLLWSFLQALFAALSVACVNRRARDLLPWATLVFGIITSFFVALILFQSNPFLSLPYPALDGNGLNPLLRHLAMILHPPAMYIGYVGLSVPFAFALAALITGELDIWLVAMRRWVLIAWLGLGLGLLLGMRWAYDVLGWGGYWGWDPVENAGLLPWLTTTALLHSLGRKRGQRSFYAWSFSLVIISFELVIFGTFATRSGIIQSVHAYARSNSGNAFAWLLAVSSVVAFCLLVWRLAKLPVHIAGKSDTSLGLFSREGLSLLTLVLLSTLTLSIFLGTILPLLSQLFYGRRMVAGPEWFERVTGPQFTALLLVMGICPLVGRGISALRHPQKFLSSLKHGRYGSFLLHLGVVVMAVGIFATHRYPFEQQLTLSMMQPFTVGPYRLTLEAVESGGSGARTSIVAGVRVQDKWRMRSRVLYPRRDYYAGFNQVVSVPAVASGLREDLYLVLVDNDVDTVTLDVQRHRLVNSIWLGGGLLLLGGLVTLRSYKGFAFQRDITTRDMDDIDALIEHWVSWERRDA